MMEFVIALPLLLMLICGSIQFAHLWLARLMTNYAAYCAARAALVTVCDEQSPSQSNESWPTRQELSYEGLQDPFTHLNSIGSGNQGYAKSEAQWAACKAAREVCAWTVLGAAGFEDKSLSIPNWGSIPGTDAIERKTRASVTVSQWNVTATVEHDFALVIPIVGYVLAWAVNPWDEDHPWAEQSKDTTDDAHRALDLVPYPHVRITSIVTLPKPYRTVIASGNWMGSPPASSAGTGW
jgi:hypothetical protein